MAITRASLDESATWALRVNFRSIPMSDEQFYRLCGDNPELDMEFTAARELILKSPTGTKTGFHNATLTHRVAGWAEKAGDGLTFDSSTIFALPSGAKRSPDTSWVRQDRWDVLSEEEQEKFAPLCPDFVAELRSRRDRLPSLQTKMKEYIDNGARLGLAAGPDGKARLRLQTRAGSRVPRESEEPRRGGRPERVRSRSRRHPLRCVRT